ncbi:hypothetical protein E3T54_13095 [Cryobacterium sp. Sr8]|uniref:hypothetical protein n=1 Tax=Cryobacterium sp. Sr8 TaxID=1259203 RepID=UPI0010695DDC|nr:hypothetical protein [Cryobacterium sp. Sr8]TFD74880.1 hypothetical protein E3T54_13095 [Cryobacterium sp. Sr8]
MKSLMDVAQGTYRVSTLSGATYVIDLGAQLLCRAHDRPTESDSTLRQNGDFVDLVAIIECSIGRPMILLINLNLPGVEYTTRRSTMVVAIESLASSGNP